MKTKKNCRVGTTALVIALVCSIVAFVVFQFVPGENVTGEYKVYVDVKGITSTYALMDYCHENGIEYSISNGVFSMQQHTLQFDLNKAECEIKNDRHMNNLWLLEHGHHDIVETHQKSDGSTSKSYMLKTWGTNYEMYDGQFTTYNMWPALIALFASIIFVIVLVQNVFLRRTSGGRYAATQE